MAPPVYCSHCGLLFQSRALRIGNARHLTLSGGETCIRCGARAEYSAGVFNVINDAVEVIAGPDTTVEHLRLLGLLAADLAAGKITPEKAIIEAERIRPGSGALVTKWLKENAVGIAGLVLAGAALIDGHAGNQERAQQFDTLLVATEKLQQERGPEHRGATPEGSGKNRKAKRADNSKRRRV